MLHVREKMYYIAFPLCQQWAMTTCPRKLGSQCTVQSRVNPSSLSVSPKDMKVFVILIPKYLLKFISKKLKEEQTQQHQQKQLQK